MMRKVRSFTTPPARIASEPDLPADLKAAIMLALRMAWAVLRKTSLIVVQNENEETISAALERILNDIDPKSGERTIRPLSLFSAVTRESKASSIDGGIKKMPDLLFRPVQVGPRVRNLSDWGFWVEAKIINGRSHPAGLYITKGIARFLSGDYAPRMPCSGMVAYVRDGSTPGRALAGHASLKFKAGDKLDIGTSTHGRPPMVSIELSHLWLDAS